MSRQLLANYNMVSILIKGKTRTANP